MSMFKINNSRLTLSDAEKERPQTTSAKIIFYATWTIIFCLAVLMVIGMWSDMLVDNQVFVPLMKISAGLAALFIVFLIYVLFIGDTFVRRNMARMQSKRGKKGNRNWALILGLLLVIPTLFIVGLGKGLPYIEHYLRAHEGEMLLTISGKGHSYRQRHCSGRIEFKDYPYLFNDEICGIQETDWDSIQPGQKILLIGKQSDYGFSVERYQLLEKDIATSAHSPPAK